MPINVEINETQDQSNEVKVGQFRTDGEGTYGVVITDHQDGINFLVVDDGMPDDSDIPYVNYSESLDGSSDTILRNFPFIIEGRIIIEGYRK